MPKIHTEMKNMTIFKILFAVCAVLEIPLIPWFLKVSRHGRCTKSQIIKTVCATLFVLAGVLACVISNNRSEYAHLIIVALLLGWCGDFLLHLPPKPPFLISGALAFLAGHLFYIYAYCVAMNHLFPEHPFWVGKEIIACLVFTATGLVAMRLFKVKLSAIYLALLPYVLMLTFMFVKAGVLGFAAVNAGLDNSITMCILLVGGAFLFGVSDFMLGVSTLRKPAPSYAYKVICIITYFMAQFMLASTIFVI